MPAARWRTSHVVLRSCSEKNDAGDVLPDDYHYNGEHL